MLKRCQNQFKVFENIFCGVIVTNNKGVILWVNREGFKMLGRSVGNLIGRNLNSLSRDKKQIPIILKSLKPEQGRRFFEYLFVSNKKSNYVRCYDMHVKKIVVEHEQMFFFTLNPTSPVVPGRQTVLSIIGALNSPYIFTDGNNVVQDFNQKFSAISGIEDNESSPVAGRNLKDLITKQSWEEFQANKEMCKKYLLEISKTTEGGWSIIHKDLLKDNNDLDNKWKCSCFCHAKIIDERIIIKSKRAVPGNSYVLFNEPVNVHGKDLRIRYKCEAENPSDLSAIIGSGQHNKNHIPDENGYFFGFGANDRSKNVIQKRCIEIAECSTPLPGPGRTYQVEIERVGATWRFKVDNIKILEFVDSRPLIGPEYAYFYFYTFGKSAAFYDLEISHKPSKLDMEKLRILSENEIVFISNPAKIFSMYSEPGAYYGKPAILNVFKETSATSDMENVNRLLKQEPDMARLDRAGSYIAENMDRIINFKNLAKLVSMGYTQFFQKFKKKFGVSPRDYHGLLRIQRAEKLLKTREYQVKEIAYMLGYENERSFHQIFKRKKGISPTDFQYQSAK
ncbi:MAG: helix-turn-helix domain-containing protein [bacterium]